MLPVKSSLAPTFSRMIDDFFNREMSDFMSTNFANGDLPAVNVKETDEAYVVELAAPGLRREDFQVELKDNVLSIRSEVKDEHKEEEENGRYTRREFSYRAFQRSFSLDQTLVDDESINATYQDGVLNITLPKREEAKPKAPRVIEIG